MTKTEIINKVLSVIDEVSQVESASLANNYPIETVLDQAGRELLLISPIGAIDTLSDFANLAVEPNEDGSGTVSLPEDFLRLSSFKMLGWTCSVYETIAPTSSMYKRQFHRATRGGVSNPVVALYGSTLEYFSLPAGAQHLVSEAKYVSNIPVGEQYPSKLLNTLIWLCATMSLKIMNEFDLAKVAGEEYDRMLNNLFISYGK